MAKNKKKNKTEGDVAKPIDRGQEQYPQAEGEHHRSQHVETSSPLEEQGLTASDRVEIPEITTIPPVTDNEERHRQREARARQREEWVRLVEERRKQRAEQREKIAGLRQQREKYFTTNKSVLVAGGESS